MLNLPSAAKWVLLRYPIDRHRYSKLIVSLGGKGNSMKKVLRKGNREASYPFRIDLHFPKYVPRRRGKNSGIFPSIKH